MKAMQKRLDELSKEMNKIKTNMAEFKRAEQKKRNDEIIRVWRIRKKCEATGVPVPDDLPKYYLNVIISNNKSAEEEDKSKMTYSVSEVEQMTDDQLLNNFTRVTGLTHLSCKHCHYDKVELISFIKVIRKWITKKQNNGLHKEMSVPRTCDHQSFANIKRQPYYTKIKNALSEECAEVLKANHRQLFATRRKKIVRKIILQ